MPQIRKDNKQPDVYYFKETEQEQENRELKESFAELQEREKQRDKNYTPKHDFTKVLNSNK